MNRKLFLLAFSFFVSLLSAYAAVPTAPTNLGVADVHNAQFTATWTSSPGATLYRIDVSSTSNFSSGNILLNAVTTPSTPNKQLVTGLTPGTTYYFRLRAVNVDGTSPNSFIRSLVTVPAAPTLYNPVQWDYNYFEAAWTISSGTTDYRIDVSLSGTFSTFIHQNLSTGNHPYITINNLLPGTKYYFRVRAMNSYGVSDNSNVSVATTLLHPGPPYAVAATDITPISFVAHWLATGSSAGGGQDFEVQVAQDTIFNSPYRQFNTTHGDTSLYMPFPTSVGGTWYYRVRAFISTNISAWSNVSPPVHLPTSIKAYPNPVRSTEFLNIDITNMSPDTNVKVTITDLAGGSPVEYDLKVDASGKLTSHIPVTMFKPGTYILKAGGEKIRFVVE